MRPPSDLPLSLGGVGPRWGCLGRGRPGIWGNDGDEDLAHCGRMRVGGRRLGWVHRAVPAGGDRSDVSARDQPAPPPGTGQVVYLSKFHLINRVMMLSGPFDEYFTPLLTLAPWITGGGFATPAPSMYGFTHVRDPSRSAAWTAPGVPGPQVTVDANFVPYVFSHRLTTSASPACMWVMHTTTRPRRICARRGPCSRRTSSRRGSTWPPAGRRRHRITPREVRHRRARRPASWPRPVRRCPRAGRTCRSRGGSYPSGPA